MSEIKPIEYVVDREKRKARRTEKKTQKRGHRIKREGKTTDLIRTLETSPERAENLQLVREMAHSFINTVEFYKAPHGGSLSPDEAVKQALSMNEWRRGYVEGLEPHEIDWGHIGAVAEHSMEDGLALWIRVREAAEDELESGTRAAKVVGNRADAYARAQFLAIRDSFADQWQPQGGIESAMIDMLTIAFSLQMYWSTIAHQRADRIHNAQEKELNRYENKGWKSPYQYEADAVDQAHRLADGYNRQFLRVLRQLRDLRRYSPIVIQNNGGQVNVGNQQMNIKQ